MICGALAFVILFIAFCSKNPEIAKQIGQMFSNGSANVSAEENKNKSESENGTPAVENLIVTATNTNDTPQTAETLNIPAKVANLTGYIPVQPTGKEVTQEKADEILSSLSKGETGEGLTFDGEIYPYYAMLNDTQKAIYRQIYANAGAMIKNFSPVEKIAASDLKNAFTAVVNDHPELFWMETAFKYQYAPTGQTAEITLSFNVAANNIDESKAEFDAAVKPILDATYGYYTDYEKEKITHDMLIGQVKYDLNAPMNQSAYSALVYGRSVCAGYARAFQHILQQLKIPCYYVTGYAGQNHAWNIVKLDDGEYYNVDSTWDDTDPNTYDYFNRSDADYAKDHARRDLAVNLPPCGGTKYRGLEKPPATSTDTVNNTAPTPQTPTAPQAAATPAAPAAPAPADSGNTQTAGNAAPNNAEQITVQAVRGSNEGYIGKIADYYLTCFEAMMAADGSNIGFDIAVKDKNLWKEISKAYTGGGAREGYIDRYLTEKHQNSCTMNITAWEQSDGSWMIRHEAAVR